MTKDCNQHIRQALFLARQLDHLARQGESSVGGENGLSLFGIMRECAATIQRQAEKERERHIAQGIWTQEE